MRTKLPRLLSAAVFAIALLFSTAYCLAQGVSFGSISLPEARTVGSYTIDSMAEVADGKGNYLSIRFDGDLGKRWFVRKGDDKIYAQGQVVASKDAKPVPVVIYGSKTPTEIIADAAKKEFQKGPSTVTMKKSDGGQVEVPVEMIPVGERVFRLIINP